ncbi:hypothetical protein niasHT_035551 [Heterodera trifolii]|uniref:Uncharacterized protein n=1 Tax=Heterodera trifolii TaxID=157864 RepID=A0ABD2I0A3_9BILA
MENLERSLNHTRLTRQRAQNEGLLLDRDGNVFFRENPPNRTLGVMNQNVVVADPNLENSEQLDSFEMRRRLLDPNNDSAIGQSRQNGRAGLAENFDGEANEGFVQNRTCLTQNLGERAGPGQQFFRNFGMRHSQNDDDFFSHPNMRRTSTPVNENRGVGVGPQNFNEIGFYVFMLFSVFVPQQNMPNNVMIYYNNEFVPIEQQYLSYQPSTNPVGQKCEFIVEQMGMNKDMPKVSIWANLDGGSETIQKLGETDIRPCELDNGGHSSYCETELEIKPNEIDTLPKMLISNVEKYKYNLLNNGTKVAAPRGGGRKLAQMAENNAGCGSGQVKFTYINGCPYKLWLYRTSLEHPQATVTPLESGTVAEECVPNVLTSGRVVPNTDCDNKDCKPLGEPPISLFEMTFDPKVMPSQFFDASYVDGVNVPIGARFKNCDENGDKTITFNNQLTKLDSLKKKLSADMFVVDQFGKTQIKSLCGTYNSDDVCCRAAYGTPETCQPTKWAPEKQAIYNVLRAANPDAYTYAYDDGTATKTCSSANVVTVGFCTNV